MANDRVERMNKTRAKFTDKPRIDDKLLPIEEEFTQVTNEFTYGDIWSREGIPLQTRSLVTIGILAALYRAEPLRWHIDRALERFGTTPEQIMEVIYQSALYAGIPTGANAQAIAHGVFKQRGLIK